MPWCYNWWSNNNGQSTGHLDYVPMLKVIAATFTQSWAEDVKNPNTSIDYLISYNEPDINGIDPITGASVYKSQVSDQFPSKYLGAPALTNSDPTFAWWKTFLANCADCKIDFWPVHWYDGVSNGAYFQKWVNDTAAFASSSGKGTKVWLTEIGFRDPASQTDMKSFLETQLPFLDGHPDVERYAFTAVTDEGLAMLSDGQTGTLMTTGKTYMSEN